ncbi:D(3) dopamine receptor-like [Nelusetta ayraudi]|uniref:D(3) dopamine receptor-like n=1 Tax=Nelusetta ayraudi TaxID=303726 RepID=UPI003F6ECE8B
MIQETSCNQTSSSSSSPAFLTFNCSVLSLTLVLGSPWNLWVCWLVFRTRSLRNVNTALLVSLAAADLLKCCVDSPLLLLSLLLGPGGRGQGWGRGVCALQRFTFALCSGAQLLTLVSISVERFQALAFPFQTQQRRLLRVRLWIPAVWGCGLALAGLSLALAQQGALCHTPPRGWDGFGACVLVPLWGVSLGVIVVHYGRIFRLVRQHRQKVFDRGVELGHRRAPADPWGSAAADPTPSRRTVLLVTEAGAPRPGSASAAAAVAPPVAERPEIVGAVCFLTSWAKERGKKRVEGKLAKRFGYIIVAFMLSWLPLVAVLLLDALWHHNHQLLVELETTAMVLTCVQAAVDPLIYTLVTRQFRSELAKLLSSIPWCPYSSAS